MICLIILKRRRSNLIKNLEENQTDNTDTKTEKDYHLEVINFILSTSIIHFACISTFISYFIFYLKNKKKLNLNFLLII